MFRTTTRFRILCSLMAQGALVMSTIPKANSGQGRATPISNASAESNSVSDILQYISTAWDTLTRKMDRCESLEDSKTGGEAVLYLPAEEGVPPAIADLQNRCHVRVERLPAKIT